MNIKIGLLFIFVLQLLSGCATLKHKLTPTTLYSEGENLRINMSGNNPPGTYTLETTSGKIVASADFKPMRNSTGSLGRGIFWFGNQHRNLPSDTASSCMRIRKPDNTFLSIQTGYVSSSEKFKIPMMEYAVLADYEVPALRRAIADRKYKQDLKKKLEKQLTTHKAYSNGSCVAPDPGPKPSNACISRHESDSMYREYCFNSNVVCSVGGAAAVTALERLKGEQEGYQDAVKIFAQNSCSLAVGKSYGQPSDIWAIARSIFVGIATESIYHNLVNDNPNIGEQVIINTISGAINFNLCLNDSYQNCRLNADRWMSRSNDIHRKCLDIEKIKVILKV